MAGSRASMARARRAFLDTGQMPDDETVPQAITASWRRSWDAGVDDRATEIPHTGQAGHQRRLLQAATGPLRRLATMTADLPVSGVLTDETGTIRLRVDGDRRAARASDAIDLAPGFVYDESAIGTNGIGTAIATGAGVYVDRCAHFRDRFQDYVCAGEPIRDPFH